MSIETDRGTVPVPKGVTFAIEGRTLRAKGPKGSVERPFPSGALKLSVSGTTATLELLLPAHRKSSQALLKTWVAHVRNIANGLVRGVEARMKIVAAHFPMKVQVRGEEIVIDNFLGEKHPRSIRLMPGTKAAVDGDFVILTGCDVEQVGQSAANLERITRIRDYDPRVFQDGIYLVDATHVKEAN